MRKTGMLPGNNSFLKNKIPLPAEKRQKKTKARISRPEKAFGLLTKQGEINTC